MDDGELGDELMHVLFLEGFATPSTNDAVLLVGVLEDAGQDNFDSLCGTGANTLFEWLREEEASLGTGTGEILLATEEEILKGEMF
jgi:hypothetical protein